MTTTTQLPTAAQRRALQAFVAIEDATLRRATLREVAKRCRISIAGACKHAQALADVHGELMRVGQGYQTPDAVARLKFS